MKTLSGIKDIDLKILQELEDTDFDKVCSVNKYVKKLCDDETFWLNRLMRKMDIEEIRDIKEDNGKFLYKEIYRYLFMGDTRRVGILEAVKRGNLYLFRKLWKPKNYDDTDILQAGDSVNRDIISYLFSTEKDPEITYDIGRNLLRADSEVLNRWLFRMNFVTYEQYFDYLIEESEYMVDDYLLSEMEKYLSRIKGENYLNLAYLAGLNVHQHTIDITEKIIETLIKNNKTVSKEIKERFIDGVGSRNILNMKFLDLL